MIVFEKPGKENTEKVVNIALTEAKKRGIKYIVAASTTGGTAEHFKGQKDVKIIIVRSSFGLNGQTPQINRMSQEKYNELTAAGLQIVTAAHALSGAERSLSTTFKGIYPLEIIAAALRMLGQGTKVCVEISAMACDNGAVPPSELIIAVAGTSIGADTAVVLQTTNSNRIMETKVSEILCKPSLI
jgi:uncharacterized protein